MLLLEQPAFTGANAGRKVARRGARSLNSARSITTLLCFTRNTVRNPECPVRMREIKQAWPTWKKRWLCFANSMCASNRQRWTAFTSSIAFLGIAPLLPAIQSCEFVIRLGKRQPMASVATMANVSGFRNQKDHHSGV